MYASFSLRLDLIEEFKNIVGAVQGQSVPPIEEPRVTLGNPTFKVVLWLSLIVK